MRVQIQVVANMGVVVVDIGVVVADIGVVVVDMGLVADKVGILVVVVDKPGMEQQAVVAHR